MAHFASASKLSTTEKEAILQMWNTEYPKRMHHADLQALDRYLEKLENTVHYLATDEGDGILGWLAVFTRDSERWLVIIIDERAQGKGICAALLEQVKATERILNGWVVDHDDYLKPDGSPYRSPLAFYQKHGFIQQGERLEGEDISAVKVRWQQPE